MKINVEIVVDWRGYLAITDDDCVNAGGAQRNFARLPRVVAWLPRKTWKNIQGG